MFLTTYKASLKNLLRSALLWAMLILMLGVAIEKVATVNYTKAIVEDWVLIDTVTDLDEEFHIDYGGYVQALRHHASILAMYAAPLFAIVSVILVLSRDYKDNFFEIEKAGGVSALSYFFGRLCAVLTVNVAATLAVNIVYSQLYCFTRDVMGNLSMSFWEYLSETLVRNLRLYFLAMLPGIIFYIGLTYMVGCLFKSGFLGSLVSTSHLLMIYVIFRSPKYRLTEVYEYVVPSCDNFFLYWGYYDTEWFTNKELHNPWSAEQLIMHTAIIAGIGIIGFAVSYICIRRRKI